MIDTVNMMVFKYSTPYEDSLISGTIQSSVHADGTLVSQSLYYNAKFPQYIRHIDTVTITDKTVIEPRYYAITAGLQLSGGKNSFGVMPTLGFKTKTGVTVYGGYDFINQTVGVGCFYDIQLKKKKGYS
mgnify:CR=1 FL=1